MIFLPFLINCTLTHFLMAEFGCLASTPLNDDVILCNREYFSYLHFFKNDTLGVGSTSEWIGLEGCTEICFLVTQIGPTLVSSAVSHFTSGSDSSWFTHDSGLISPYQSRNIFKSYFNDICGIHILGFMWKVFYGTMSSGAVIVLDDSYGR